MTELRRLWISDEISGDSASVSPNKGLSVELQDRTSGDSASVSPNKGLSVELQDRTSGAPLEINSENAASVTIKDSTTGMNAKVESNGALAVNVQDQHSQVFDIIFKQSTDSTTLSVDASKGDLTLTLTSVIGFTAEKEVVILAADGVVIVSQVGAPVGNVITIDTPLPYDIVASTVVSSAITEMNVNGSVTPQSFKVGPVGLESVDITRIIGVILDSTAMDDEKFGGITALTNGVVFRKYDSSEDKFVNYWNVKSNGNIALLSYDTKYIEASPAGVEGFRFRYTVAGQEMHGVTIRLNEGDYLEILIQDDLTGLNCFRVLAQGHLVMD